PASARVAPGRHRLVRASAAASRTPRDMLTASSPILSAARAARDDPHRDHDTGLARERRRFARDDAGATAFSGKPGALGGPKRAACSTARRPAESTLA